MANLPASGVLGDTAAGHTNAEFAAEIEDTRDVIAELLGGGARTELTLSGDAIVPPDGAGGGTHTVDTEGNAASDDLRTITTTNTPDGRLIRVMAENAARVVTIKHAVGGAGEILLRDSSDFVLTALDKWVLLQLRGTSWVEIDRSYGVDYLSARADLRVPRESSNNILCPHERLIGTYVSASTATWTADAVTLTDTSGNQKRYTALSDTLTISGTGANGRDVTENAGAEKASDWYHVWAIGKEDGTLDVFASLDCYPGGTSIFGRLPSGYAYAGYIGAIYNNASSNFIAMAQKGASVSMYTGTGALVGGTATSWTAIALSAFVPDSATAVKFSGGTSSSSSATTTLVVSESSSQIGSAFAINPGGSTGLMYAMGECVLTTAQQFGYRVSGTNASATIDTYGWRF